MSDYYEDSKDDCNRRFRVSIERGLLRASEEFETRKEAEATVRMIRRINENFQFGLEVKVASRSNIWRAEDSEGEWVDDPNSGRVRAVMVGDDYEHVVDVSDLVPIDDNEYCSGCGQIGCSWGAS